MLRKKKKFDRDARDVRFCDTWDWNVSGVVVLLLLQVDRFVSMPDQFAVAVAATYRSIGPITFCLMSTILLMLCCQGFYD